MKFSIRHQDPKKAYTIAEKMVNAVSDIAINKSDNIPSEVLTEIVSIVKESIRMTLDIIIDDASELVVTYDIEKGIGNTFESVCSAVKSSMKL